MTWVTSIDQMSADERRRKRIAEDGEHIHFDIMMMDSAAPSASAYDSLPPEQREVARAYDEMIADYQRGGRPASADPPKRPAADADPVAAAYEGMMAEYARSRR